MDEIIKKVSGKKRDGGARTRRKYATRNTKILQAVIDHPDETELVEKLHGFGFTSPLIEYDDDVMWVCVFEHGVDADRGAPQFARQLQTGWRPLPGIKTRWKIMVEVLGERGVKPTTGKVLGDRGDGKVRGRVWVAYKRGAKKNVAAKT